MSNESHSDNGEMYQYECDENWELHVYISLGEISYLDKYEMFHR
jgi:hypothetical protein